MTKIAYFCEPQAGGTFSFFRRMQPLLVERGIDFRCIPPVTAARLTDTPWAALDGMDAVSFPETDLPVATGMLIEHLRQASYDAVMVLPGTDVLSANLVRYLPRSIRALARVPMITRGAYAPTQAIAAHLNRVCAVSRRVRDDLVDRYRIPQHLVEVIYNGVDVPGTLPNRSFGRSGEPFRLMYSGRIWDLDKGVLLLPDMLERVRRRGVDARLLMAGSGPDEPRLREAFARRKLDEYVQWLGGLPLDQVGMWLAQADCFVLPSRFEGCPNALLEAMAYGCPSVAARIRGSVDQIIEDGKSGFLADVASPESFATRIVALAKDPDRCARVGQAAREHVMDGFTADHTASQYAAVLQGVVSEPDHRLNEPLALNRYHVPAMMQPTWRTRIPAPLKNWARKWLERFGISS